MCTMFTDNYVLAVSRDPLFFVLGNGLTYYADDRSCCFFGQPVIFIPFISATLPTLSRQWTFGIVGYA